MEVPGVSDDTPQDDTPKLPLTVDSPIFWAEELIENTALHAFYAEHGIRCFDCCAAFVETFKQGAEVHKGGPHGGFDPEKIVEGLNRLAADHPRPEDDGPKGLIGLLKRLVRWLVDLFF
jgi:hypothetical protein